MVSAVTAIAKTRARLERKRAKRRPLATPHMAHGKKSSRQNRDRLSMRNRSRQKTHGTKENTAVTQSVRRDMVPETKPPVQDHAPSRKRLHSNKTKPTPRCNSLACTTSGARYCCQARLTETEKPIRRKLPGSASPKAASHGRQFRHKSSCRRATNPITARELPNALSLGFSEVAEDHFALLRFQKTRNPVQECVRKLRYHTDFVYGKLPIRFAAQRKPRLTLVIAS